MRYAKTTHHCHAHSVEAFNQVLGDNMPATRRRTQWRPRKGLLVAAGPFSLPNKQGRALLTVPDASKGRKATAECSSKLLH